MFFALAVLAVGLSDPDPQCDLLRSETEVEAAERAFKAEEYAVAARSFQDAFDACPNQHVILLRLSETDLRRRDFEQAIRTAQQFLQLEHDSIPGRLALANAYFMAQRLPDALREANEILKSQPAQAGALKLKGNIEYISGDLDHALDAFIALLDKHPDDEEGAYMLGRIYYQEGRIEQSAGLFQRVLRMNPQSYKALDNLGLCYQALGEQETATRYFLTSIKVSEESGAKYDWAYANLANLLLEKGEAGQAFAAASKAADRNPYSARNFYIGGKALARLGKNDLSINWLERSASLDPKYPEPLYALAKAYAEAGRNADAKAALEKFRAVKAAAPRERK